MTTYDTAQVCLNGHFVCTSVEEIPEQMQKFCSDCGAETITQCPSCSSILRGQPHDEDYIQLPKVTAYCYECGKPYPWTLAKIEELKELIELDDKASSDSKELAISAIPDIIRETPKTRVAATKMQRFFSAAGKSTKDVLEKALVSTVCEVAKRMLFP